MMGLALSPDISVTRRSLLHRLGDLETDVHAGSVVEDRSVQFDKFRAAPRILALARSSRRMTDVPVSQRSICDEQEIPRTHPLRPIALHDSKAKNFSEPIGRPTADSASTSL